MPKPRSTRSLQTVKSAHSVADYLDGIGEHKRANDVRSLCRSNLTFRTTLQQLHRDNMELRAQLQETAHA